MLTNNQISSSSTKSNGKIPSRNLNHQTDNDDDGNSNDDEEEEDYHGAAQNLLDIRNPSRWNKNSTNRLSLSNLVNPMVVPDLSAAGVFELNALNVARSFIDSKNAENKEFSITKVFEPKFMQLYEKYCESIKQAVDVSNHLMTICLDNLVTFSCWARENQSRGLWIKQILDDNIDLRPEVRNGLAMILIYVFSSAQAQANAKNNQEADMFTVLQDADSGLGIVNKTSLKIYNDPYGYFNFLKSCISGLIDSGKIPENERQNQVN
jgi:hypothetical protein